MPAPVLLFTAHPLTGHLTPTLRVAAALAARLPPSSVFFLGPTAHQSRISASANGAITFLPLLGTADIDDLSYYSPTNPNPPSPAYWTQSWQQRGLTDFIHLWIDPLPSAWASLVAALRHLAERDPSGERDVVLISEAMFFGALPLGYGAVLPAGIRRPRMVALSVTVPFIRSGDVAAFFVAERSGGASGVIVGDAAGEENELAWRRWEGCTAELRERLALRLREVGAARPLEGPFLSGQNYRCHERILQLGVAGWFFPRTDWPEGFRFAGVLPPADEPAGGWANLPGWWEEAKGARAAGRKVVVVAQGTVEVDPNDLIIPTVSAMASREDVLVVAILGRKGAVLPGDFSPLPANARVTDYLHYDAVLPYADAWVHNGGYGAVQHGIAHGVPMVVAGEGQDKTENAKRIAWSGAGLDLGKPSPAPLDVRKAVESVLDIEGYRQRAEALSRESKDLCCFDAVEREIRVLLEETEKA